MLPDPRSIHRFFSGLSEVCPVARLSHVHLIHWSTEPPSPLDPLREAGFRGTVVAARASLADAIRHHHPGLTVKLDDRPTAGEPSEHLLMELPQGREAARLAIETALAALAPEGRLWLFGERESGIRSLAKRFSDTETALCKGHLRLHTLTPESRSLPEKGQSAPFRPEADGFAYIKHDGLRLAVKPGIFSWRAIDAATLLLLDALREAPGARVLDWGCGSGVLGTTLAQRFPETRVTLSDDLITATACARRTVEINGLSDRCEVITEDGIGPLLGKQRFDAIVTNPPFHRGVRTDHDATLNFLASAAALLAPGGTLWLVGNRFMDYGTLLKEHLGEAEEFDGDDSFTVWRGVKSALTPRQKSAHTRHLTSTREDSPRNPFRNMPSGRWIGMDELS
ncbi:MAG: class I SAM-dependent methyltransferase [Magnetococcales bacterium]|nr:class I SAM-dependent methyltransferase [Magnetococcales bacterium]